MKTLDVGARVWWFDTDGLWSVTAGERVRRGVVIRRKGPFVIVRTIGLREDTVMIRVAHVRKGWVAR